jgi:hypothetical protein
MASEDPDDSDSDSLLVSDSDESSLPVIPTGPKKRLFQGNQPDDSSNDTNDKHIVAQSETTSSHPGYPIVWDNVGKMVKKSHPSSNEMNMYAVFANCLMVKSRISFHNLESQTYERRDAVTIPLRHYLPGETDFNLLHSRMVVLTEISLVTFFVNLQQHKDIICWNIPHAFADQSKKKK